MLFNSFGYAVFLPVIFLLHWIFPAKWRWALLLAASCFFYASWGPHYLPVLFAAITVSYFAALYIQRLRQGTQESSGKSRRLPHAGKTVLLLSVLLCHAVRNRQHFSLPAIICSWGYPLLPAPFANRLSATPAFLDRCPPFL